VIARDDEEGVTRKTNTAMGIDDRSAQRIWQRNSGAITLAVTIPVPAQSWRAIRERDTVLSRKLGECLPVIKTLYRLTSPRPLAHRARCGDRSISRRSRNFSTAPPVIAVSERRWMRMESRLGILVSTDRRMRRESAVDTLGTGMNRPSGVEIRSFFRVFFRRNF
jgi:hypothetical protein